RPARRRFAPTVPARLPGDRRIDPVRASGTVPARTPGTQGQAATGLGAWTASLLGAAGFYPTAARPGNASNGWIIRPFRTGFMGRAVLPHLGVGPGAALGVVSSVPA